MLPNWQVLQKLWQHHVGIEEECELLVSQNSGTGVKATAEAGCNRGPGYPD